MHSFREVTPRQAIATAVTPPNYFLRNEPALMRDYYYLMDYFSNYAKPLNSYTKSQFYSD